MKPSIHVLSLLALYSSCSFYTSLSSERGPASQAKLQLVANVFGENDSGFRYLEKSNLCLKGGEVGFNVGYVGECGDLSSIKYKKLKEIDFKNANLRGAKLNGLDFSGMDLSGADLSGSNLRGTILKGAKIEKTKFNKAQFNDKTKMALSSAEALAQGMLQDSFNSSGASDVPSVAAGKSDYKDLLITPDVDRVREDFIKIRKPNEKHHKKVLKELEKVSSLDASHLILLLDVCFYQNDKILELQKVMMAPILVNSAAKDFNEATTLAGFNNLILAQGLEKVEKIDKEEMLELIKRIIPLAPNFDAASSAITSALAKKTEIKTKEDSVEVLKVLSDASLYQAAGARAVSYLNEFTDKSIASIIEVTNLVKSTAKDDVINNGLGNIASLTSAELTQLADMSSHSQSYLRGAFVKKVSDLTYPATIGMADKCTSDDKDTVVMSFLDKKPNLSSRQIIRLSESAYSKKAEIIKRYEEFVKDITLLQVGELADQVTAEAKDSVLNSYLSRSDLSFTTNDLLTLSAKAYATKELITVNYGLKVTDLNSSSIMKLAGAVNTDNKDRLITAYLALPSTKITAWELSTLARSAYSRKDDIRQTYLGSVTDLKHNNFLKILGEGTTTYRDSIATSYLKNFVTTITSKELIEISSLAYAKKDSLKTEFLDLISDWNENSAVILATMSTGETKDKIIEYYLKNKAKELSFEKYEAVTDAAYSARENLKLTYKHKISDMSTTKAIRLAQSVNGALKDLIIEDQLKAVSYLTIKDFLHVCDSAYAQKANFLLLYYNKILDQNADTLAQVLYKVGANQRDAFLFKTLKKNSSLTLTSFNELYRVTYSKKEEFILTYGPGIRDLTVEEAIEIASRLVGASKDTFLLSVVDKVSGLTQSSVALFASAGNTKMVEILQAATKRL